MDKKYKITSNKTALYICYQSLFDPLTQTQVVAYLEGLARDGYTILLLTFEPRPLSSVETREREDQIAAKGIAWRWLRYHKRPTIPATAWDILSGIVLGWRLGRQHHINLVHARAHVPGSIALILKWLTGAKMLFDIRGFMAEEYADAGVWSEHGLLFRMTKNAERRLVRAADGIVVLTEKAKTLLQEWYPDEVSGKPIQVIPCCVDRRGFSPTGVKPKPSNGASQGTTIVYTGKLGGWYPVDDMVRFVAIASRHIPDLCWQVWTQSESVYLRRQISEQKLDRVRIGRVEPDALPNELVHADSALSLYRRNLSAPACSPTKIGEYLAAGLPVVSSSGIGDVDALLRNEAGDHGGGPVGVLVKDLTESSLDAAAVELKFLLKDAHLSERCRAVAAKRLDLERVGWVRYRQLYSHLLAR